MVLQYADYGHDSGLFAHPEEPSFLREFVRNAEYTRAEEAPLFTKMRKAQRRQSPYAETQIQRDWGVTREAAKQIYSLTRDMDSTRRKKLLSALAASAIVVAGSAAARQRRRRSRQEKKKTTTTTSHKKTKYAKSTGRPSTKRRTLPNGNWYAARRR